MFRYFFAGVISAVIFNNFVASQIIFGDGDDQSQKSPRVQDGFTQQNSFADSGGGASCLTVSGVKIGAPCVFPFRYRGVTYQGCPVDLEDPTKRWCSTKVDANGEHVTGQGEYGHCGSDCPIDDGGSSSSSSPSSTSGVVSSPNSAAPASCFGSTDSCRSIGACALRFSQSEIDSKRCQLSSGEVGLCCPDLNTNNNGGGLFPNPNPVVSGTPITNFALRQAVDIGASFVTNVTEDRRRFTTPVEAGSATERHGIFQSPKEGVEELNRLALIATEAARNLQDGGLGTIPSPDSIVVRQADTSSTVLANCYPPPNCDFSSKYRTADGSCNNQQQPLYGKVLTPLQRVMRNAYSDGLNQPRASKFGSDLPSARLVSRQTVGKNENLSTRLSALMMSFGQFLDHDMSHVPIHNTKDTNNKPVGIDCCTSTGRVDLTSPFSKVECFPIKVTADDPIGRECMNFVRSQTAPRLDCLPGPSEQINQITHWLDSSNVYGSQTSETIPLRTFTGGLLRGTQSSFGGKDLLPPDVGNGDCKGSQSCFKTGDRRTSEQPNLAVIHTLFFREHNRLARALANVNPQWSDEMLFQEAKRINNAQWQHIVFNEFLPILVGPNYMDTFGLWPLNSGFSNDYRDDFDPTVTSEFTTAAFRVGHTMIPSLVKTLSSRGSTGQDLLRNMFFNVDALRSQGGVDNLLRGLTQTPIETIDDNFSDEITNHLFDGRLMGLDLIALNIQRGRDHGIQGYVEYRKICRSGKTARSFDDLGDVMSSEKISRLRRVYQNVEDVDLFPGMFLEEPGYNGAFVGPTFLCLIGDQFGRLKKGDRFFYDLGGQAGSFTSAQLTEIRHVTMARIICDNGDDIQEMQPLAFQLPNQQVNSVTSCQSRGNTKSGYKRVD